MQKADVLLIRAFGQTKQSCALDMSARMVVWNHSLFKIVSLFFFVHLFIFIFFQQHHKLSDKLDRLSDGEREEGF